MIQPRENEDKRFQNVCLKGISEVQNIYGDARIQRPMKRCGRARELASSRPSAGTRPSK